MNSMRIGNISLKFFDKCEKETKMKYFDEKIIIRDFNFKVKDLKERGLLKSY